MNTRVLFGCAGLLVLTGALHAAALNMKEGL